MVALAFGVGMYGCGVASMFVELITARQLAASRHESLSAVMDTVSWTTAPVAEELIKILPLLIAGWALRRRMQWGLTDFVVLGGATGAGFGLLESLSMYGGSAGRAVDLPMRRLADRREPWLTSVRPRLLAHRGESVPRLDRH